MSHGEERDVVEQAAPVAIDGADLQEDGVQRPEQPAHFSKLVPFWGYLS